MSKELFVSSTPHETKVAIVEEDQLAEVYFERENEYTLAGSIYKGRVTRVLPGMQSAFVNVGLERDAFLYVSDFLLEEEDEADALDQVVSRGRGESRPYEPRPEPHAQPIEAQDIIPPAEPAENGGEHEPAAVAAGEGREEGEREGSRKWRGRRRRGRGRDRERPQERAAERPQESRTEAAPEGEEHGPAVAPAATEAAHEFTGEAAFDTGHEMPREVRETPREARSEAPRAARSEAPSGYGPIVLPGESISKYQPHAAQPSAPAAKPAPPRPMSRPSTEYSVDLSAYSPGSMVLPGESIAKYRHDERPQPRAAREVETVAEPVSEAVPEPAEAGSAEVERAEVEIEPRQQAGYAYHAPLPAVAPSHVIESEPEEAVAVEAHEEAEAHDEVQEHEAGFHRGPALAEHQPEESEHHEPTSAVTADEMRHQELHRQQQLHAETVFPYLAGHFEEAGLRSAPEVEEQHPAVHEESAHETGGRDTGAPQPAPWQASGRGLMEEEEIEEEESDLPGYEEQLDLADYEELEEEELAPLDDQLVPLGSDLTEAVRDAHVNEHATGQYEAEGLDLAEELEEAEAAEEFGHEEGEELDLVEEGEEAEGVHAEPRAGANGAPQRGERGGRPERRRGGKPPQRRMRGRPRSGFQRHLPAITDLLKEGQEILVQIAKEPIAKKGARITSHIALPGRFLVYMPTVHHTGVSRKIASEEDRQRLKRIVTSERGDANGGFIVRTAAAGASEEDLRADIRFLINLWNEIKGRADSSKAPALIYHDLNLVERILRDQVTTGFSSIWVDTEQEYERVVRFVSRFQPSLLKRVKLYTKDTPLFEQFNISDEINKALKSKVWLKSGGYIVINQTEALVAIDVNTGKYVGKTARLEDTIVKTNIDAIREIVRQIRLRDLGGIIVIDFIDMDERKNRHKVMQALEEALKADRAPSKVLQFNDFGLVAITRKRVKQSLERTLGQQCVTCTGTGMVKSVSTVCNEIYVEMRKMSKHFERDVMLRVNPEVAKALKGNGARWLQEMEELTRRTILVKSDALLHPEQFDIQ